MTLAAAYSVPRAWQNDRRAADATPIEPAFARSGNLAPNRRSDNLVLG